MTMDVGRKPRIKERDVKKQFDSDKRIKPKNEERRTEFLYGELGGNFWGYAFRSSPRIFRLLFFFYVAAVTWW